MFAVTFAAFDHSYYFLCGYLVGWPGIRILFLRDVEGVENV